MTRKKKKVVEKKSQTRIPNLNSNYRHVSTYFSKLEFMKLFSEKLASLAYIYHDEANAARLLKKAVNSKVKIINMETFLAPKWALADDIGSYLYVYKKERDLYKFVENVIVHIKRKEQSGSSHIDLSSVLFYFTELRNVGKVNRKEAQHLISTLAASTFYPTGVFEESPYYLRIFQQKYANKVAERMGLQNIEGYTGVVGTFLKKLMEMRESVIKCGTVHLTQCILMENDCRKNQEGRLGFSLSESEARMRKKLQGIEDLSVETPELVRILEDTKIEHEYYHMNVHALIHSMKNIKEEETIHTIDRVNYTLYSNFEQYFGVHPKDIQDYGIETEYIEEEGLFNSFAQNLAAIDISCSDLANINEITDYIFAAADLLMISARQVRRSFNRVKIPDSKLVINLLGITDITTKFISKIKELEGILSSKHNREFCITISYTEEAIRSKGGLNRAEYIRVISDIHADVNEGRGYEFDFGNDYVINCGDTAATATYERDWIRTYMKRGVIVPGNHLGYESAFPQLDGEQNIAETKSVIHWTNTKNAQAKYLTGHFSSKQLKYLSNDILETDFAYIIGTPLYTDFALFGEDKKAACMMEGQVGVNDFKYCYQFIKDKNLVRKFTVEDHCMLFRICRGYIANRLRNIKVEGSKKKVIVVTHHAPTPYSVAPEYKNDPLSACFASDMRKFINEHPEIRLWVHGHLHSSFDYIYNGCRVVAEPFGYYWENNNEWKTPEDLKNYGKRIPIEQITSRKSWKSLLTQEIESGEVKVYDE